MVPTDTVSGGDVDTVGDPTIATLTDTAGEKGRLFTDSAIEGALDTSDDPTVVRTRFVNINFDLLGGADDLPKDLSAVGDVVVLNLFDDLVFTAVLDRVEPNRSGGYSWICHLKGVEYSQVILVVKEGLMAGNITLPRRSIRCATLVTVCMPSTRSTNQPFRLRMNPSCRTGDN